MRLNIVVLTGAGISAESGLSTFRGEDGLWNNEDLIILASSSYLYENPQACLDFYNSMRRQIAMAEPNHAHRTLAELERDHEVTIITQNVDNLHERAGNSSIIHLHGEMTKVTSSSNRLREDCIREFPLETPIKLGDKAADQSQLRPAVVLFGEYLDSEVMEAARSAIKEADILLVIGTSLMVAPANGLIKYAYKGSPKFIIDPAGLEGKLPEGFKHIRKAATEGIDDFLEELSIILKIYE